MVVFGDTCLKVYVCGSLMSPAIGQIVLLLHKFAVAHVAVEYVLVGEELAVDGGLGRGATVDEGFYTGIEQRCAEQDARVAFVTIHCAGDVPFGITAMYGRIAIFTGKSANPRTGDA